MKSANKEASQSLELTLYSSNTSVTEPEVQSETKLPAWSIQSLLANFQGGHVFDSVLTMLAATVGSGVLMISNAMSASGLIWSVVQMLICGFISYFSLITLVKAANTINVHSYQDLALNTYGHWCRILTNLVIFCLNFGTITLYLKLITGMFAASMSNFFGTSAPVWMTDPHGTALTLFIATFFVFPLAVGEEYKALRYFCLIKFTFVSFFLIVVIYEAFDYASTIDSIKTMNLFTFMGFTSTFPTGVFAYSSHVNVLDVFQELRNRSVHKMIRVINWATLFVFISYVLIGILGYTTFASNLSILHDPSKANGLLIVAYGYNLNGSVRAYPIIVVIGMLLMALAVIISQPFNIRPAKASFRNIFRPFDKASKDQNAETPVERYLYTFFILYAAVILELNFTSSQHILNVIGSSVFPLCCFILPSMYYLKAHETTISPKDRKNHLAMIFFNVIFTVWTTISNLSGNSSSH